MVLVSVPGFLVLVVVFVVLMKPLAAAFEENSGSGLGFKGFWFWLLFLLL